MADTLHRTYSRLIGLVDQVAGSMAFHVRHTHTVRDVALDKNLKGLALEYALQRALKVAAVSEVARAVRAPADALDLDLDDLNEDHFALYLDAIGTALSVLIMDPRRYLRTEDRKHLPPTSVIVKANPEDTDGQA